MMCLPQGTLGRVLVASSAPDHPSTDSNALVTHYYADIMPHSGIILLAQLGVLNAGPGGWSFQDLLELLLPLTAGAVTHALEHLASLPSFSAAALCVFSLIEPSVISAGWPLQS